jgi:hypothetical protein
MLAAVGQIITKQQPDFDSRSYGYSKLSDLMAATALFELDGRSSSDEKQAGRAGQRAGSGGGAVGPELAQGLAAAGHTVFVSSHLMSETAQTATRLVVVGRGRLIADTTVEEFVASSS